MLKIRFNLLKSPGRRFVMSWTRVTTIELLKTLKEAKPNGGLHDFDYRYQSTYPFRTPLRSNVDFKTLNMMENIATWWSCEVDVHIWSVLLSLM